MSTPFNPITANWTALRVLAPDRFDAFTRSGDADELTAISRYVWNMAISGELYPILHAVEITFRNQLHNALTALHGATWFDTASFLTPDEVRKVSSAKNELTKRRRTHDPGRVVAELSFGFWTELYRRSHEFDVVRPTIQSVFPYYQGTGTLSRSKVATPLRDIRLLRNRISHHEHIVFDINLPTLHTEALDLIRWMSPQMADIASINDNFIFPLRQNMEALPHYR